MIQQKPMTRRFIIYTRGRTGSSAIVDELDNYPEITCHGEVFRANPLSREKERKAYEEFGDEYIHKADTRDRILPYKLFRREPPEAPIDAEGLRIYLDHTDREAVLAGSACVGAKLIRQNGEHELLPVFRSEGVAVIYLEHRNKLRQAISALLAQAENVYNAENYVPASGRRFRFTPEAVLSRIRRAESLQEQHAAVIEAAGLRWKLCFYEDWVADRDTFLAEVFGFLGAEQRATAPSRLSRTTPETLAELLENYDGIASRLVKAGFGHYLKEA